MQTTIKIAESKQSNTNVSGRTEGPAFDALVASIREKGVLVPVLARKLTGKSKIGIYEVIAGNRRLAAAKEAGLEEIPAVIVEMNDIQAREAQIIENLHREGVHPLDEGEAYRLLIEKSKPRYEVKDVAIKVGKSETYVRQRLALTNLSAKAAKMFRAGKLKPVSAVLIARIEDAKMQDKVISDAGEYRLNEPDRLRDLIQEHVYKGLSKKPWANDAKLAEMVGDKVGHTSLFGDKDAGTDPVAYATQMSAYIEIKIREAKEKGEELVKICTDYNAEIKGVLPRDSYRKLESKEAIAKAKTKTKAIVAQGDDLGQIYWITTDKEAISGRTIYKQTPKEKAARKKQLEEERIQKLAETVAFQKAIDKVKFPLSKKQLDVLYELAFKSCGWYHIEELPKLMGLDFVTKEQANGMDSTKKRVVKDAHATIKKYADENDTLGKLKLIFAMAMPLPSQGDFINQAKKIIKSL